MALVCNRRPARHVRFAAENQVYIFDSDAKIYDQEEADREFAERLQEREYQAARQARAAEQKENDEKLRVFLEQQRQAKHLEALRVEKAAKEFFKGILQDMKNRDVPVNPENLLELLQEMRNSIPGQIEVLQCELLAIRDDVQESNHNVAVLAELAVLESEKLSHLADVRREGVMLDQAIRNLKKSQGN